MVFASLFWRDIYVCVCVEVYVMCVFSNEIILIQSLGIDLVPFELDVYFCY